MDQYNLLIEPIFTFESQSGVGNTDLPGLLAGLGRDHVLALPRLQRHQEDAFHIFLCYLAGAVLARHGPQEPVQDSAFWRDGIRKLTGESTPYEDSAWTLVVEDPCLPAFMQPPVTSPEDFAKFGGAEETPDALDLLITTKNHDIKCSRSVLGKPEDWVYALVNLQTMSGYLGRGNYGIARMNGGFGSRPVVSVVPVGSWGNRWRTDVRRLLRVRPELLAGSWSYQESGLVLAWVTPWDRQSSLRLNMLDPFFIEVSRAVRLIQSEEGLIARTAPSQGPRLAAKEALGVLGDPWIPIKLEGSKGRAQALTVGPSGLTAELLRNLLFHQDGGYQPAAMQLPGPELQGEHLLFSVSVLVRGQGTTDGFHHAEIPVPERIVPVLFARGHEHDRLAAQSRRALENAGSLETRVLKPAVLTFLEGAGGDRAIDWDQTRANTWWQRASRAFRSKWSDEFFPWLWRTFEDPDDGAERSWLLLLRQEAETVLHAVMREYPRRQGRRYRSQAVAQDVFLGALYKQFPQLKEQFHEETDHQE